MFAFKLITRAH